jgi:hypothetical protein
MLRAETEIVTIFGSKMVTISARKYKHIQNKQTSQGYIFRILFYFKYFILFLSSLREITFFCLDKKLV